jgi:hypothetical protein
VLARFAVEPDRLDLGNLTVSRRRGRELEIVASGNAADIADIIARLRAHAPEALTTEALSLEEVFVSVLQRQETVA